MSPLRIDESLFLGKGNERLCYIHPKDPTKVIKIAHKHENARNQNKIEAIYYDFLERRGVDFSHLTRCYGWIDVKDSKGLIFERIVNSDGSSSVSFTDLITKKIVTNTQAKELLEALRVYLEANKIIFADVALDNIMCQKQEDNTYKLIIVDGLGSRRLGFKFWLYRHFPLYTQYKLKHQWNKVLRNFNDVVKSSSL